MDYIILIILGLGTIGLLYDLGKTIYTKVKERRKK